jgi:hypothetical protein
VPARPGQAGAGDAVEAKLAKAELKTALSPVEELGVRVYAPVLHLELGKAARIMGDDAASERHLRQAHDLFLEVGAPARAREAAVRPVS